MKRNALSKIAITLLLITLCAAVPALALADTADLTVQGTAVVSINPDFATLTLGYYAENSDLMTAQADTAKAVDAIIAAVTALGVEKQDIVTSNFSIGPVYNYNTSPSTITGYRVENMLTITVKDIQQVASVMNAALEAGANQSYGISFDSTERGEAYRQALKEAIAVAKLKAEAMA
ncbi:MAG TPA: SIMPL domain-containing protein, partial [Clostridia bacterium]|nr:SIMPL domain-containing protein [Clostridia bacterium]